MYISPSWTGFVRFVGGLSDSDSLHNRVSDMRKLQCRIFPVEHKSLLVPGYCKAPCVS